jgi:hypothetical protein
MGHGRGTRMKEISGATAPVQTIERWRYALNRWR